jgi:hypothetical protein
VLLLRDLLQLHLQDEPFDDLKVPTLSGLQPAATETGRFVWASRDEILTSKGGDKLTPVFVLLREKGPVSSSMSATLVTAGVSSSPPLALRAPTLFALRIDGVTGLRSVLDVYCEWTLLYTTGELLQKGVTSVHTDEAESPCWSTVLFELSTAQQPLTLSNLRDSRLIVHVRKFSCTRKRLGRLFNRSPCLSSWLAARGLLGEGSIELNDVLTRDVNSSGSGGNQASTENRSFEIVITATRPAPPIVVRCRVTSAYMR